MPTWPTRVSFVRTTPLLSCGAEHVDNHVFGIANKGQSACGFMYVCMRIYICNSNSRIIRIYMCNMYAYIYMHTHHIRIIRIHPPTYFLFVGPLKKDRACQDVTVEFRKAMQFNFAAS